MSEQKEDKPVIEIKSSLFDFFEKNANLFTIFGIFNGLTIYAMQLPPSVYSKLIGFLFMTLSIIIWAAILLKSITLNPSLSIRIMLFMLSVILVIIVVYWAKNFPKEKAFLITMSFAFISYGYIKRLVDKYKVFKIVFKSEGTKKVYSWLMGLLLGAVVNLISEFIIEFLDGWLNERFN